MYMYLTQLLPESLLSVRWPYNVGDAFNHVRTRARPVTPASTYLSYTCPDTHTFTTTRHPPHKQAQPTGSLKANSTQSQYKKSTTHNRFRPLPETQVLPASHPKERQRHASDQHYTAYAIFRSQHQPEPGTAQKLRLGRRPTARAKGAELSAAHARRNLCRVTRSRSRICRACCLLLHGRAAHAVRDWGRVGVMEREGCRSWQQTGRTPRALPWGGLTEGKVRYATTLYVEVTLAQVPRFDASTTSRRRLRLRSSISSCLGYVCETRMTRMQAMDTCPYLNLPRQLNNSLLSGDYARGRGRLGGCRRSKPRM